MIVEMSLLMTSLKTAYDIAKGVNALKSEVDRNQSISEILEVLIAVEFQASSVLAKAHELEIEKYTLTQRIMDFEKWSETEKQYDLKEIAPGIFVYCYKTTDESTKPMHWLCAKCFHERKAYIVQADYKSEAYSRYFCPNCRTEFDIHHSSPGSSSPSRGSGGPHGWMSA